MRRLTKHFAGWAAGLVIVCASGGVRAAEFTCSGGLNNNVRVITLGLQTTSSTTPVDIPGTSFTFEPDARCLVVEITGQVRAVNPEAMRLRVAVTGGVESGPFPSLRDVYTASTAYDGRSATFFVTVTLLEGEKTVRVQFMSVDGTPVSLNKGVILIHYERRI